MNSYYHELIEKLGKGAVRRATWPEEGIERIVEGDAEGAIIETLRTEPHIVMFGAGHIGKALHDLGSLQGMKMTVLDEREELLNETRFPNAERIVAPFPELLSREYDTVAPIYVIFTHGHKYDTECLAYCLRHDFSYLGMIGSRKKSAATLQEMRSRGFSEEKINSIHTPIGLSIGAETPEEIAVSIMAEIIASYRSEKGSITVDLSVLRAAESNTGVMVRIIEKEGSAPRALGSSMFVASDRTYGTIGGGAIELEAEKEARRMLSEGTMHALKVYDMSAESDLGMVCGGRETLLFTKSEA